jgi:hypothetical protein
MDQAVDPRIIIWACVIWACVLLRSRPYLLLSPFWFPRVIAAFEGGSLLVRAVVAPIAIGPPGALMGFGFPTGMRLVNAIDVRPTPWFWAVNGSVGVLAAGTAVARSVAFSINVSLWVGASFYLLLAPIGVAWPLWHIVACRGAPWLLRHPVRVKQSHPHVFRRNSPRRRSRRAARAARLPH